MSEKKVIRNDDYNGVFVKDDDVEVIYKDNNNEWKVVVFVNGKIGFVKGDYYSGVNEESGDFDIFVKEGSDLGLDWKVGVVYDGKGKVFDVNYVEEEENISVDEWNRIENEYKEKYGIKV